MKKIMTLSIVHQDQGVLLGLKKRGFGEGRWNGFGGKIKDGETILEGAKRELFEEAQIKAKEIEKIGILEFKFKDREDFIETHFFKIKKFFRQPKETEEMKPKWFREDKIPFEKMWPDDKFWMPFFLKDKKFKGTFLFDRPSDSKYQSKIIKKRIEGVESLGA